MIVTVAVGIGGAHSATCIAHASSARTPSCKKRSVKRTAGSQFSGSTRSWRPKSLAAPGYRPDATRASRAAAFAASVRRLCSAAAAAPDPSPTNAASTSSPPDSRIAAWFAALSMLARFCSA